MLEPGNDAGFLLEPFYEFIIFCQFQGENLDRHMSIHGGLMRFVDSCHAPFTYLLNNAIRAEHLPGLKLFHFYAPATSNLRNTINSSQIALRIK